MSHLVLIVEDNPLIRSGLVTLVGIVGHRTLPAASIGEAAAHLDAAIPTHLLLDLNLPDGHGTEVLRRIRERGLPARVAILTGTSDTALLAEARALGVDAVFIKPPDWNKVIEWVSGP